MKKSNVLWFLGTFAVVSVGLYALGARAEGGVICVQHVGTAAARNVLAPMSDGGTPCNWAAGAAVIMQCVDGVVCYDPKALDQRADGGPQLLPDAGYAGPVATSSDLCAAFANDSDPILIGLNPGEHNISIIAKSVLDAGMMSCKFAETRRRIPAP